MINYKKDKKNKKKYNLIINKSNIKKVAKMFFF